MVVKSWLAVAAAGAAVLAIAAAPTGGAGEGPATPLPPPGEEHALERTIAAGEVHAYTIELEAGRLVEVRFEQRGADLVITTFGPAGVKLGEHDSPTGAEGPERVALPAAATGRHRLEVRLYEGEAGGRYGVIVDGVLSPEEQAARVEAARARHRAATDWLAGHAIRLAGPEPGRGFADMEPLAALIGDARVVALGEATHGSREFFQLKHRMLEFLVERMGFTAFAIEATMPESFDVDRYVLTGEGDPRKALSGLYFWTWDTEEVLALIEWMRRYNADPAHVRKVRFYGFDMQTPVRAARVVLGYLERADPGADPDSRSALVAVADPFAQEGFGLRPEAEREAVRAAAGRLAERLDLRRDEYEARTGDADWELARQHARVLVQNLELAQAGNAGFAVRDRSMADNVLWLLDREGPDGRVVLWAHNGHVSTVEPWMGHHLRRALGDAMVVFGFAFEQGGFQAQGPRRDGAPGFELQQFEVEPGAPETLETTLAAAGLETAAVDLRALPEGSPAAEWLRAPRAMRSIGAFYDPARGGGFFAERALPPLYDALLFVRRTSPARRNPWLDWPDTRMLPAPANLGFEDGAAPGAPPGWWPRPGQAQFDVEVGTDGRRPHAGRHAATLRRVPGRHYGELAGSLRQRIDAAPWRGKTVRLRAAVRAEVTAPGSAAHLFLQVNGAGFGRGPVQRTDTAGRPIRDPEWRLHELTAPVPADAESIEYGLALTGDGQAWIDSVAVERLAGGDGEAGAAASR